METLSFEASIESDVGGPIKIPYDVKEIFGRARQPVRVTINGYSFRSTVAVYGGVYFVPLRKSHAEAADVKGGAAFTVTIGADDEERTVEVPDDLARALDDAGLRQRWNDLSFTHQREHVEAIAGAKRPDTRECRIAKAVADLSR